MLTLLKTDEHPGLQIWSGGRFVDVPPRPGTFIVNLGDMLERCDAAVSGEVQPCHVQSIALPTMLYNDGLSVACFAARHIWHLERADGLPTKSPLCHSLAYSQKQGYSAPRILLLHLLRTLHTHG